MAIRVCGCPSERPVAPWELVDAKGSLGHLIAHVAILADEPRASKPAPRRQVCERRKESTRSKGITEAKDASGDGNLRAHPAGALPGTVARTLSLNHLGLVSLQNSS